jgi:hypothetical protein
MALLVPNPYAFKTDARAQRHPLFVQKGIGRQGTARRSAAMWNVWCFIRNKKGGM